MKILSENAFKNLEAGVFLAAVVLGVAFIPPEDLLPACGGVILAALSAFFGFKLYARRLDQAAEALGSCGDEARVIQSGTALSAPERALLGLAASRTANDQISRIRRAQRILLRLEEFIALIGVCALLTLGIGLSD